VRFSPLTNGDVRTLLLEQGLVQSDAEAEFASVLSEGSLATARQLLEPELRALRSVLYSQLAAPNFSGLSLSKQLIEGIGKISSDVPEQRRNGQWLIRFTVEFFRTALWILNGAENSSLSITEARSFANRFGNNEGGPELLGNMIDRAIDASSHIDQYVTFPLALDSLFDDLARMLRTVRA
jgi:hypothetical protein